MTLFATRAEGKRALRAARADVPAMVPLWRAVMDGRLVIYMASPDGPLTPFAALEATGKPSLVMVTASTPPGVGPADWPGAAALLAWCATAFVAPYEFPREAYEVLVEEVVAHRRFLWVEPTPEHAPAWQRELGGMVERPALTTA